MGGGGGVIVPVAAKGKGIGGEGLFKDAEALFAKYAGPGK